MAGLMTVAILPFLFLWSIVYGIPGGIFFKMLAVYEHWVDLNRLQVIQWKRYPLRSYRKFTSAVLTHRMRSRPVELVNLIESQIQAEYRQEPFPFLIIFTNTVVALAVLPFAALSGMVLGPVHVFRSGWEKWQKHHQPQTGYSQ